MADPKASDDASDVLAQALLAWADRGGDADAAWSGVVAGPSLDEVASRLTTAPRPFLDESVSIAALAGDVIGGPSLACLAFAHERRVRTAAALGLWLVASESVVGAFSTPLRTERAALAVDALALRLGTVVDPLEWLSDDERREEAVRTFLFWGGQTPAGEDVTTARALLAARDSLQRNRALAEAFEEHRHRAEVAGRLAEARAREAAARYSTE